MELLDPLFDPDRSYVSTGTLPVASKVDALVAEAHSRFSGVHQGEVSSIYPALARVSPRLFGISVVDTDGGCHNAGDAEHRFTIMSISKPFVFAVVCDLIGATGARARLGVNATGRPFNSLAGIEGSKGGYTNPMVNWLAIVVRNDWSAIPVLFGLVVFGIGQGALVTLVFNVLVTSAPKELAGDVGSLRGTTNNLAAAVGTALAGALMVGLLSAAVMSRLAENPVLPVSLQQQVDLDNINFVSNERFEEIIAATDATAEQKAEAIRINTEARLMALKIGLLILSGLAMLTIIPAGRLPAYRPGDIPPP